MCAGACPLDLVRSMRQELEARAAQKPPKPSPKVGKPPALPQAAKPATAAAKQQQQQPGVRPTPALQAAAKAKPGGAAARQPPAAAKAAPGLSIKPLPALAAKPAQLPAAKASEGRKRPAPAPAPEEQAAKQVEPKRQPPAKPAARPKAAPLAVPMSAQLAARQHVPPPEAQGPLPEAGPEAAQQQQLQQQQAGIEAGDVQPMDTTDEGGLAAALEAPGVGPKLEPPSEPSSAPSTAAASADPRQPKQQARPTPPTLPQPARPPRAVRLAATAAIAAVAGPSAAGAAGPGAAADAAHEGGRQEERSAKRAKADAASKPPLQPLPAEEQSQPQEPHVAPQLQPMQHGPAPQQQPTELMPPAVQQQQQQQVPLSPHGGREDQTLVQLKKQLALAKAKAVAGLARAKERQLLQAPPNQAGKRPTAAPGGLAEAPPAKKPRSVAPNPLATAVVKRSHHKKKVLPGAPTNVQRTPAAGPSGGGISKGRALLAAAQPASPFSPSSEALVIDALAMLSQVCCARGGFGVERLVT